MTDYELSDPDYDRLGRLVAGELPPDERASFEAWLAEDPRRAEIAGLARRHWEASGEVSPVDVDSAWQKLKGRIYLGQDDGGAVLPPRRVWWRNTGVMMRAAAAAVVILGGPLVWWSLRGGRTTGDPNVVAAFQTRPAERRDLVLPDGSAARLGVASSLVLGPGFGSAAREVSLSGEAYFNVKHDAARPFRVKVRGSSVEDLGTEFSVRGYPDDSVLTVAVTSGLVEVRSPRSERVTLRPRDVAEVAASGSVSVTRDVDVARYNQFMEGRLTFDNVRLAEAIPQLERWYDVEFRISDPVVLARSLSVSFSGESLDVVLETIGITLGVRLERRSGDPRVVELAPPVRTGLTPPEQTQVGDEG